MNVGPPFITNAQSAKTVQPSEGAFNDLTRRQSNFAFYPCSDVSELRRSTFLEGC